MEISNQSTLNPWLSIWTKPRATIQQIVESNPTQYVLLLAALGGVSNSLDRASVKNTGDLLPLWLVMVLVILGGSFVGVLGLYVGSFVIRWTGKWIGGVGNTQHIRAAMAWANVPSVVNLLIWVPQLLLVGHEMFTKATPRLEGSLSLSSAMLVLGTIQTVMSIWAIFIFFKSLGQVQGFSAWKALGNVCLATLILIGPIVVAGILFAVLIPMLV